MARLVVIGGDAAGASAAGRAKRLDPSRDVVVFEKGEVTSYAACGLPYLIGGEVGDGRNLVARTPDEHRAAGLDVRTGHDVVGIDLDARCVTVHDMAHDRTITEGFDDLVIATGASPIRPPLAGIDASGILGIRSIPDADAIDAIIDDRHPERAVVVGAGYIGVEMAEALVERGLHVTMVEQRDTPMATLDAEMSARVADAIRTLGVDLRLGTSVEGFAARDGWVAAVATDDGECGADLVVMGLGMRPNVALAEAAGVPIGPSGAIATDARMATRIDGVWAAGDCVESLHRVSHRPVSIALGTHANKQGRVVGTNVAGGAARFPGVVGTAITRVGTTEIARTGLNETEAAAAGFATVSATAEGHTRAFYYPGAEELAVKVVAERSTGRILGAQIVGGPEAGKRIDVLALAVWTGMGAEEFSMSDLSYAPPVAPVWETSMIAARLAAKAVAADPVQD
jgi:NADPH-dependent 2,4-dienoyl-CoA reductase/sulfur reductase-like enzyme